MKVTHFLYSLNYGGIETWLQRIEPYFFDHNIKFEYILLSNKIGQREKLFSSKIFHLHGFLSPIKTIKKLLFILKNSESSILHVHNIELLLFAKITSFFLKIIYLKKTKIIFHAHNDFLNRYQSQSLFLYLFVVINKLFLVNTINLANSVKSGNSYFRKKQYQYVPLFFPINYEHIQFSKRDFQKRINIGHIGRFTSEKNHVFLFEVFHELFKIDNRYNLICIGSGVEKEPIINKIVNQEHFNNISFIESSDNPFNYYQNVFDAVVFPSISEGLGLVAIESQAFGLPSFISDALPFEAIINKQICQVIELNKSSEYWAHIIHNFLLKHEYDLGFARDCFQNSDYNIHNNKLINIWEGM